MKHDSEILGLARAELEAKREDNIKKHERRENEIFQKIPRIAMIEHELARQGQMAALLSFSPEGIEELEALEKKNLALQEEKKTLLKRCGYSEDYLEPIYFCPVCQDRGNGKDGPCECVERIYKRIVTEKLSGLLRSGNESFENFRLDYYNDEPSHRETMEIIFGACKKFADNFPNVSANLLFCGGTGLGKTYLSACIARQVSGAGYSVCYDTASAALSAFEQEKFGRDTETREAAAAKVRNMLDCDLMILDDLGTEIVTSVSTSALYTLINSRIVSGKRMIISTNCSLEAIKAMYTQQIYSRIAGEFLLLPFVGSDIRLKRHNI